VELRDIISGGGIIAASRLEYINQQIVYQTSLSDVDPVVRAIKILLELYSSTDPQLIPLLKEILEDIKRSAKPVRDPITKADIKRRLELKASVDPGGVARVEEDLEDLIESQERRRAVPAAIKYRCNRKDQTEALTRALKNDAKKQCTRPVVLILQGSTEDVLDAFIQRLRIDILPKLLCPNEPDTPVNKQQLVWPSVTAFEPGTVPFEAFWRSLCNLEGGLACSTPDEISDMVLSDGINLIVSSVDIHRWRGRGKPLFEACLSLWNEWPNLPVSKKLVVCLTIEYSHSGIGTAKQREQSLARKSINNVQSDLYPQIYLPSLPPLEKIRQFEVNEWINAEFPRLLDQDRLLKFRTLVNRLFQNEYELSMDRLLSDLDSTLNQVL
jgi:hypothetical protein